MDTQTATPPSMDEKKGSQIMTTDSNPTGTQADQATSDSPPDTSRRWELPFGGGVAAVALSLREKEVRPDSPIDYSTLDSFSTTAIGVANRLLEAATETFHHLREKHGMVVDPEAEMAEDRFTAIIEIEDIVIDIDVMVTSRNAAFSTLIVKQLGEMLTVRLTGKLAQLIGKHQTLAAYKALGIDFDSPIAGTAITGMSAGGVLIVGDITGLFGGHEG